MHDLIFGPHFKRCKRGPVVPAAVAALRELRRGTFSFRLGMGSSPYVEWPTLVRESSPAPSPAACTHAPRSCESNPGAGVLLPCAPLVQAMVLP